MIFSLGMERDRAENLMYKKLKLLETQQQQRKKTQLYTSGANSLHCTSMSVLRFNKALTVIDNKENKFDYVRCEIQNDASLTFARLVQDAS